MDIDKHKLLALRKERGWSQSRLADISGLGERTIQRIEKEGSCSLESAMALASVYEMSPKDLTPLETSPATLLTPGSEKPRWASLIGILLLLLAAWFVIDLTAKYPNWELISAGLVAGLTMTFSLVSYGTKDTVACVLATQWLVVLPKAYENFSTKVRQLKSWLEYAYIVGVVSTLVCGLTIVVHTDIDPDHTLDYLAYAVRPLVYAILFAELWFRPLKHRLEWLLQQSVNKGP